MKRILVIFIEWLSFPFKISKLAYVLSDPPDSARFAIRRKTRKRLFELLQNGPATSMVMWFDDDPLLATSNNVRDIMI